jgi:hypothetical protein
MAPSNLLKSYPETLTALPVDLVAPSLKPSYISATGSQQDLTEAPSFPFIMESSESVTETIVTSTLPPSIRISTMSPVSMAPTTDVPHLTVSPMQATTSPQVPPVSERGGNSNDEQRQKKRKETFSLFFPFAGFTLAIVVLGYFASRLKKARNLKRIQLMKQEMLRQRPVPPPPPFENSDDEVRTKIGSASLHYPETDVSISGGVSDDESLLTAVEEGRKIAQGGGTSNYETNVALEEEN